MNYSKIYMNLIFKNKGNPKQDGLEAHHSVPKHWFLEHKTKKDYDHTIVFLTRREHFLAHRLLCKMFPQSEKAKLALFRMINTTKKQKKYAVSSRVYESAKREFILLIKAIRKDATLDAKRRKAASEHLKNLWSKNRKEMYQRLAIDARNAPNDKIRRETCKKLMEEKHQFGLTEKLKKNNSNFKHMTEQQKLNFKNSQIKYRNSEEFKLNSQTLKETHAKFIAVIDNQGVNHFIARAEYDLHKGVKFHHVNTKRAKEIRAERDGQEKCN